MDTLIKISIFALVITTLSCASQNCKSPNSQIGEMDMIRNAQDLTKEQQEKLIDLYRSQRKRSENNRLDLMRLKTKLLKKLLESPPNQSEIDSVKESLQSLQKKEMEDMMVSLEKVAEVVRSSNLDRDYLIRAILREHRREIENSSR